VRTRRAMQGDRTGIAPACGKSERPRRAVWRVDCQLPARLHGEHRNRDIAGAAPGADNRIIGESSRDNRGIAASRRGVAAPVKRAEPWGRERSGPSSRRHSALQLSVALWVQRAN